jgi:hypothetical protein
MDANSSAHFAVLWQGFSNPNRSKPGHGYITIMTAHNPPRLPAGAHFSSVHLLKHVRSYSKLLNGEIKIILKSSALKLFIIGHKLA